MVTGQNFTTLQETSNIQPKSHYRLSVQVSLTGLSFLVSDSDKQSIFFCERKFGGSRTPEELLFEVKEVIEKNEALQAQFEHVSVIFSNNLYSLVPNTLFEESKLSEYLKFNSKILANDYITFDRIESYGLVVVYVPYVNITNYFFDRYGSFAYFHSTSVFLKTVLDNEKHTILPKVYLNIQDTSFDCIVIKDGALELCNSYSFMTPEDFIYYVLFVLEQLSLNPDTVKLYLCGAIVLDDANYAILYRYIRDVNFADSQIAIAEQSDSKERHHHFVLKSHL